MLTNSKIHLLNPTSNNPRLYPPQSKTNSVPQLILGIQLVDFPIANTKECACLSHGCAWLPVLPWKRHLTSIMLEYSHHIIYSNSTKCTTDFIFRFFQLWPLNWSTWLTLFTRVSLDDQWLQITVSPKIPKKVAQTILRSPLYSLSFPPLHLYPPFFSTSTSLLLYNINIIK